MRRSGKHPIFCNEAKGNKQGGAPTAGSIANAFAAHRDQLEQDEVLGQYAGARVTKSTAWGKVNHWVLLGWKAPGWALADNEPPVLHAARSRDRVMSKSVLLPQKIRGKSVLQLFNQSQLTEVRNLLHHGLKTRETGIVFTGGEPGACTHDSYTDSAGRCGGCGGSPTALKSSDELAKLGHKYYRRKKVRVRSKTPANTSTGARRTPPGSGTRSSRADATSPPSFEVTTSPKGRRFKLHRLLEADQELIDPTLAMTLAATNQRKLPIPDASPTKYGQVSGSDARLAQIVTMSPGAVDGSQLAAYMAASAEVLATWHMQQRLMERVRPAPDAADGAPPSQRPRYDALRSLMHEAGVPIGLTDDSVDRLANSSVTDMAGLTAAYGNESWAARLLAQTNLPIATHMALQEHFGKLAAVEDE